MVKRIISLLLVCSTLCACNIKNDEISKCTIDSPAPSETEVNENERPPRASVRLESLEEFQRFIAFLNNDLESDGNFSRRYGVGDVGYKNAYLFYRYTLEEVKSNLDEGCYPTFDSDKIPDEYITTIYEPILRYDENGKATSGFLGHYDFYFKIDNIWYVVQYFHKEHIGAMTISSEQPNWEIDGVRFHLKVRNVSGKKRVFCLLTQINNLYYMELQIASDDGDVLLSDINFDGIHFF